VADNYARNRAGQIVREPNDIVPGALRGLADMLLGAGRGAVTTTLGAPADILNLLRVKQLGGSDIPYGSEYFRGALPLAPTSQTGKVSQSLGEFVPLPTQAVTTPVRIAGKVLKESAPHAARHALQLSEKYGVSPTMNVIKPKGGNWLAGSVEEAIKPLVPKTGAGNRTAKETLAEMEATYPPDVMATMSPETRAQVERGHEWLRPNVALQNWLDTKLGKYIRNEMGTLEDPLRELAGRGITHVPNKEDLMMSADWIPEEVARRRRIAGYPEEPTSTLIHAERGYPVDEEEFARMAAGWENAADSAISPFYARTVKGTPHEPGNPWINKVDPETMVYQADRDLGRYGELGFPHLIDELKNAMNPNSGLPRNLQLDPAKLDKITVPQASELVAKINAWRAEQKIAANAEKANNAATVLHKEYPEQGYKWVELKAPEGTSSAYLGNKQFESPEANALQDALKYEGETMGHCVGGYCPDVIEGRSRIFSLRDKKGEPHVTIETSPSREAINVNKPLSGSVSQQLGHTYPDLMDEYSKAFEASGKHSMHYASGFWDWLKDAKPEIYNEIASRPVPQSIVQIKGKANKKPKDEYLPFVQDFVRSGKWSDVGDIQNTGMRATRDVFSEGELGKLREAGETDIPHILSGEDIQRLHNLIVPEGKRLKYDAVGNVIGSEAGFAEGGLVDDIAPDQAGVNHMVDMQEGGMLGYAEGGLVGLESKYGIGGAVEFGLNALGKLVRKAVKTPSKEEALAALEASQKANLKHESLLERLHRHYLNEDPKMAEVVEKTYDDMGKKVDLGAASKAYDQGFVLPGSRVSYSKHIGVRSPEAQYPGLHFASAGNEDQLKTLIEHYLGGFQEANKNLSPRVRPVLAQAKNSFRLSDEAFEYPDVLAKELGLSKQFQAEVDKFYSRPMNFENVDPDAVKSAIISKMVADRGLDLGVYRNTVEGVLGPGNTSYVSFGRNNLKGFASGGFVEYNPAEIENAATRLREDMHA